MSDEQLPAAVTLGVAVASAVVVPGVLYVSRSVVLTVVAFACCAVAAAAIGRVANERAAN